MVVNHRKASLAVYLAFCNIQKRLEEIKLLFLLRWKCFHDFVHNGNTLRRSQFVLCNFTSITKFYLPVDLVVILPSPRATLS